MNNFDLHFQDYINIQNQLHTNINKYIVNDFNNFTNLIIYGPPGIGKYSISLYLISKLSPTNLKYEKKMIVTFNKNLYIFKISDIHYEIDLSLLGCNSRLLWHEIFLNIKDSILTNNNKNGIILCKYFHEINNELLDIFYSYMQKEFNNHINIKFILITESLSFIPTDILNICKHIKLKKPKYNTYEKCFKKNITSDINSNNIKNTENIKDILINSFNINYNKNINNNKYDIICKNIINELLNENINYLYFRNLLYEICIYELDFNNCIYIIINYLINNNYLNNNNLPKIIFYIVDFLKLYNNNYRQIYHLEKFLLNIKIDINNELLQ